MGLSRLGTLTDEEVRSHPAYKRGWDLYLAHKLRGQIWPAGTTDEDRTNPYLKEIERECWACGAYSALGLHFGKWPLNLPPLESMPELVQADLFD